MSIRDNYKGFIDAKAKSGKRQKGRQAEQADSSIPPNDHSERQRVLQRLREGKR